MIVTEFQLDRFRGGNPLRVLDLGNGLNVALVRSGAGCAELLNVIPSSFYGPAPFFAYGDDDPLATDTSGQLVLRTDQGVFRIQRNAINGDISIHSLDGTEFGHDHLNELLDGVHAEEYRDLFTFNLDYLKHLVGQGVDGLPKLERMAEFLMHASQDAAEDLHITQGTMAQGFAQEALVDLSSPEGALKELYQMLKREATDPDGDGEELSSHDREKITRDLKKVDSSISDANSKITHLESEISETQCALAINRSQERLGVIDRELAELADVTIPSAIVSASEGSIERLNGKITDCKQQLSALTGERDELIRQGQALRRDERVAPIATQIESLLLHEKSTVKEEDTIERLKLKIEDLQSRSQSDRALRSDRDDYSSQVADTRALQRIEEFDRRLGEVERDQEIAEQRLVYAENASLSLEAGAASLSGVRPEDTIALRQAENRVNELRSRLGQSDQLGALELERADAIRRIRELYDEQMLPFQTVLIMGIPFMIGVAMIIYGLTQSNPANWRLVLLGFLLTAGTAMFRMLIDRDRTEMLASARSRLIRLNHDLENYQGSAIAGAGALHEQLAAAELELETLHAKFAHAQSVEPAPQMQYSEKIPVDTARREMEQAQRRLRDANTQWREFLNGLDLPATLTPTHAMEALAQRAMTAAPQTGLGSDIELQLAAARNELEIRQNWLQPVAGKLRQLLKDIGMPAGGMLSEQFSILRDAYNEYRDRRQTRRELARSIRRIRKKAAQVQDAGRRYVAQRKELTSKSTHQDSKQQVQREMRSQRRKLLEQQRELVEEDIEEIRNRYGVETKTPLAEFSDEELEARLVTLRDKIESIHEKRLRQSEKRGRLRAMLAGDESRASHIGWDRIFEQTKLVRDEIRAATHQLVDVPSRMAVQPSDAPEYLVRAAEYLEQLSGGQLRALDLDGGTLVVVDEHDRLAAVADISPNHLPNIYFSLWLARIEAYADRGIRLPIVMEDPLGSTRAERRATVAQLLSEFAGHGHQVILVSSDPNTAATFANLDVPIADFSQREPIDETVEIEYSQHSGTPEYPTPDYGQVRYEDETVEYVD